METRETKRWDDNLVVGQRTGQGAEKKHLGIFRVLR